MGTVVSLDAFRHRKANRHQISARERAGLPELVRETPVPSCKLCGRPIVLDSRTRPEEVRELLAALRDEGLCASCYDPF